MKLENENPAIIISRDSNISFNEASMQKSLKKENIK
jgi:hypothetical protein